MHPRQRRFLGVLGLVVVLLGVVLFAHGDQTTHRLPDQTRQRQVWHGDVHSPYIISGCTPAVPGGLTFAAFACEGYVRDSTTNELLYVGQPSAAVGPLNSGNGTYWLAIHRDRTTTVAGWTRQGGTSYLWQLSATKPATPNGAILFEFVTVAGGAITSAQMIAPRHGDWQNTTAFLYAERFGVSASNTDNTEPIRRLLADGVNRCVIWPSGTFAVLSTINAQGTNERCWIGQGKGSTTVRGATNGQPVIDFGGATNWTLKDLAITSHSVTPANVTAVFTRTAAVNDCGRFRMHNVAVGGSPTVAAWVMWGCADNVFVDVDIGVPADTAFALHMGDQNCSTAGRTGCLNLVSQYSAYVATSNSSNNTFIGGSVTCTGAPSNCQRAPIFLNGVFNLRMLGVYAATTYNVASLPTWRGAAGVDVVNASAPVWIDSGAGQNYGVTFENFHHEGSTNYGFILNGGSVLGWSIRNSVLLNNIWTIFGSATTSIDGLDTQGNNLYSVVPSGGFLSVPTLNNSSFNASNQNVTIVTASSNVTVLNGASVQFPGGTKGIPIQASSRFYPAGDGTTRDYNAGFSAVYRTQLATVSFGLVANGAWGTAPASVGVAHNPGSTGPSINNCCAVVATPLNGTLPAGVQAGQAYISSLNNVVIPVYNASGAGQTMNNTTWVIVIWQLSPP